MAESKITKPKKSARRRRNRPPDLRQERAFTSKIVEELANLCGIDDNANRDRLAEELEGVSSPLRAFFDAKSRDVPIKDQRDTLKALKKSANKICQQLADIDVITRLSIFSVYPNVRLNHETDGSVNSLDLFIRDIEHVSRLRYGIDVALEKLPSGQGRPANTPLLFLCREYMGVYEAFSGKTFTFYGEPTENGDWTFMNEGSRFIELVAKTLLPDADEGSIAWSMREAKKSGPIN